MRVPRLFSILLQIFLAGFGKNGQSDGVKSFILSLAIAALVIRSFPTGQTVPQAPTVDRVSVLQSISTEEMLQIAADCMAEEGYDESDMHDALSAAIRR